MGPSLHILWAGGPPPEAHRAALTSAAELVVSEEPLEAMRVSNETDFDAAVVDLDALKGGAFTLLRHLRARASRRHMPVVFWSANGTAEERIKAFSAGADDVAEPAVNANELLARIQRGLSLR